MTDAENRAAQRKNPPGSKQRFTFPKRARIGRKREFDAAFAEGGKGVSDALVVYARRNGLGWNRLGLVVSRKNGNAVRRNRIRRLIREAFRLECPNLPAAFDLVCIPRPGGFPDRLVAFRPLFREAVLKAMRNFERRRNEGGRNRGTGR